MRLFFSEARPFPFLGLLIQAASVFMAACPSPTGESSAFRAVTHDAGSIRQDGGVGLDAGRPEDGDDQQAHSLTDISLTHSVDVDYGHNWVQPVFDGEQLVVSAESNGSIWAAKWSFDLTRSSDVTTVASPADTPDGDGIADHKHIFQNDHHYIVFSQSGQGQGGQLKLLKLDDDLSRVAEAIVVDDDPPTNDMFLAGDGERVVVGKFKPGIGHQAYVFDDELVPLFDKEIGGYGNNHANGAAAVFVDDTLYLVAPQTLAPGMGNDLYLLRFDENLDVSDDRIVIHSDPGKINIVSGLSHVPQTGQFLVHYASAENHAGGPLVRLIFDTEWNLTETVVVVEGVHQRPHSTVIADQLIVGIDGQGPRLLSFDLVFDEE